MCANREIDRAHEREDLLGGSFCQRGDKTAFVALETIGNLGNQVVNLTVGRACHHYGVQDTRRSDDHLYHCLLRPHSTLCTIFTGDSSLLQLPCAGGRGDEQALWYPSPELFLLQRPVVQRGWQSEAVLHKSLLAHAVTVVHTAHLWYRDVTFVHHEQPLLWREIINQD